MVGAFAQLQEDGMLEIITCAATHGFLPLMEYCPEAMRAQIFIGRDEYRECFGRDPTGIWLPECGYIPAVGKILQEANLRWFVIDAHGLMFGEPRPRFAIFSPYYTPAGPAVFARDRESSKQVWSAREGYPGDPAYREFYQRYRQRAAGELPRGSLSGRGSSPLFGDQIFTGSQAAKRRNIIAATGPWELQTLTRRISCKAASSKSNN